MITDYKQQNFRHRKMRVLLAWLEESTGLVFIETSSHRPGDAGVHGHGRGTDVRMRSEIIGQAIADHINDHWEYDPERPDLACAVLHGEDSNLHLHLQVHDNTREL